MRPVELTLMIIGLIIFFIGIKQGNDMQKKGEKVKEWDLKEDYAKMVNLGALLMAVAFLLWRK